MPAISPDTSLYACQAYARPPLILLCSFASTSLPQLSSDLRLPQLGKELVNLMPSWGQDKPKRRSSLSEIGSAMIQSAVSRSKEMLRPSVTMDPYFTVEEAPKRRSSFSEMAAAVRASFSSDPKVDGESALRASITSDAGEGSLSAADQEHASELEAELEVCARRRL